MKKLHGICACDIRAIRKIGGSTGVDDVAAGTNNLPERSDFFLQTIGFMNN